MKKLLILLLVVSVCISFTGTMAAAQSSEKLVTVLLQAHYVPATEQVLVKNAEKWAASKGVKVRIDFISDTELESVITSEGQANKGHDIIALREYVSYIFTDILSDVSAVVGDIQAENGKVYKLGEQAGLINGVWKAIPWFHESNPLIVRKDYIEQAGYTLKDLDDLTFDELLVLAEKLKGIGHPAGFPVSMCPDANGILQTFMWAFGSYMYDKDNNVIINSKETRDCLEYFYKLYKFMPTEVNGWDNLGNNNFILTGVGALTANPPSIPAAAIENDLPIKDQIYVAPFPSGPAGRYRASATWSFGIPIYSENKELAADLIKDILSQANFMEHSKASEGFNQPIYAGYADRSQWANNPTLSAYEPALEELFMFNWPGPDASPSAASARAQLLYTIPVMFSKVVTEESTIDEAISWAESELKRFVEEE